MIQFNSNNNLYSKRKLGRLWRLAKRWNLVGGLLRIRPERTFLPAGTRHLGGASLRALVSAISAL